MANILLQTTITAQPDDWDVSRFSLLADELEGAGHDVTARNRDAGTVDDPVLRTLDESDFDELWLIAVDVGDGLTEAEVDAIQRFQASGRGVLTARDHQDLGSSISRLGLLGSINQFHDDADDPEALLDDRDTPSISWPNYHSGANGDYQPVLSQDPVHELLRTSRSASGRIEWFPAHPHEGSLRADVRGATVLAQGRSATTGRRFNLAVSLEGERGPDGGLMGRGLAESSFHHFADYNWNPHRGAPSFVTEPPGTQVTSDPSRLAAFKDYVRNVAAWLPSSREAR
jgi:hypothetical protein